MNIGLFLPFLAAALILIFSGYIRAWISLTSTHERKSLNPEIFELERGPDGSTARKETALPGRVYEYSESVLALRAHRDGDAVLWATSPISLVGTILSGVGSVDSRISFAAALIALVLGVGRAVTVMNCAPNVYALRYATWFGISRVTWIVAGLYLGMGVLVVLFKWLVG